MNKFIEIFRMFNSAPVSYISKKTYDSLLENSKDLEEKFELINLMLSAESSSHVKLKKYDDVFKEKFEKFANKDSSLAEEVEVVGEFQNLRKELEKIVNFSFLYTKNIIAVGGGFSSGKSQFLNTFFKTDEIKLPVGIQPVTAIPTYISNSDTKTINAFSIKGGVVKLNEKMYKNMSHDYMANFKFNLKEIIPFLVLTTNIRDGKLNNICFIDTPGYNPATKSEDRNSAIEGLKYANTIIWIIPISAGTIPNSDLKFLTLDELQDKKIYIILSKCDEKPLSEIERIIDTVEEILDENMIQVEGISAYSSMQLKEYAFKQLSLEEFLSNQNNEKKNYEVIKDKINSLLDKYENSLSNEISQTKNIKDELNKIGLELLRQVVIEDEDNEKILSFQKRLSILKSLYLTDQFENLKQELQDARKTMISTVDEIFKEIFHSEAK